MNRILAAATFAFSLFALPTILAQSQPQTQSQNSRDHVITVSRGGEAFAKPDLGIAVIEALPKAGAVPGHVAGHRLPQAQEGLIIYTVKNSEMYEKQALQQAIGRARDAAQDIAKGMQVQITGLRNVTTGYLGGNYLPRSGLPSLEGLPYRFHSTKGDEVEISTTVTVDYDFK